MRKMAILEAEIAYFHDYEPFNKVFGANFVSQLKGPSAKDFLSKFCSVNFLFLELEALKQVKNGRFAPVCS